MLPELVLLLCAKIRQEEAGGKLVRDADECIRISEKNLVGMIQDCRDKWKDAWSKEYREMDFEKVVQTVENYMISWMLAKREEAFLCICPGAGRLTGFYPRDFIRLLVKVRAPKLSKEFKPTKVYEILNESLQTLPDEDLRAMVDAIPCCAQRLSCWNRKNARGIRKDCWMR